MKRDKSLLLAWPDVGVLEVKFPGPFSATIQYSPSVDAVEEIALKAGKQLYNRGFAQEYTYPPEQQNPATGKASYGNEGFPALDTNIMEEPIMQMEGTEMFAALSAQYQRNLKEGDFWSARLDLVPLSDILADERKFRDSLKNLMLAYHMDVCGMFGAMLIDDAIIKRARRCIRSGRIDRQEVAWLFRDVIRDDTVPSRKLSVDDSLYLFQMSLDGQEAAARNIIRSIFGLR